MMGQFDIDLKTKENPRGMFTEQEVYDMLMVLFTCVFINVLPEHGWALRNGAAQVGQIVNNLIEKSYASIVPSVSAVSLVFILSFSIALAQRS